LKQTIFTYERSSSNSIFEIFKIFKEILLIPTQFAKAYLA